MRAVLASLCVPVIATMLTGVAQAGDPQPPYDAKAAFAEADTDHDGEIDLCEFRERVIEIFYRADTDKNGSLSPTEYQQLPFSGDFKDADPAGTGRITLHDFIAVRYRQFIEADGNKDGELSVAEVIAVSEGRKPQ